MGIFMGCTVTNSISDHLGWHSFVAVQPESRVSISSAAIGGITGGSRAAAHDGVPETSAQGGEV